MVSSTKPWQNKFILNSMKCHLTGFPNRWFNNQIMEAQISHVSFFFGLFLVVFGLILGIFGVFVVKIEFLRSGASFWYGQTRFLLNKMFPGFYF